MEGCSLNKSSFFPFSFSHSLLCETKLILVTGLLEFALFPSTSESLSESLSKDLPKSLFMNLPKPFSKCTWEICVNRVHQNLT